MVEKQYSGTPLQNSARPRRSPGVLLLRRFMQPSISTRSPKRWLYNFASRNGCTTNPSRGKCTLTSTSAGISGSRGLITTSSGVRSTSHPTVGLFHFRQRAHLHNLRGQRDRLTRLVPCHREQRSLSRLARAHFSYQGRNAA